MNRSTSALVRWLHAYRHIYLMDVSLACWKTAETAFDRSGRAWRELTAKLRRDVAANVAKIESANFDRPLGKLPDEIDFEAIADHCWRGFTATGGRSGEPFCKNPRSSP